MLRVPLSSALLLYHLFSQIELLEAMSQRNKGVYQKRRLICDSSVRDHTPRKGKRDPKDVSKRKSQNDSCVVGLENSQSG